MTKSEHRAVMRHVTNKVVEAIRRGSRHWRGVVIDPDDPEKLQLRPGQDYQGEPPKFRAVGVGRPGSGQEPDYFVFRIRIDAVAVPTPNGPVIAPTFRCFISESAYTKALYQLKSSGHYCGECDGFIGKTDVHRSFGYCCHYQHLLSVPHSVYVYEERRGLRRNSRYINEQQLFVAKMLAGAATLTRAMTGEMDKVEKWV